MEIVAEQHAKFFLLPTNSHTPDLTSGMLTALFRSLTPFITRV
ncbi:hypothetical protein [Prevotella aurantiaca]|nr:hypothetical protein [Prevotella aurantiaca]